MPYATIEPSSRQSGDDMPDLNDLYLFTLVVEKGSFTAASRAAGLTTSRISRRIADLEERLGVRLLHRTTRKLSLTAIGELYYQHCQAMVSEAEAAGEVIEQLQTSPRGRVRITCPALSIQTLLGPIVTDFMQMYPEVKVSLTATDRLIDLIDEGCDVAIRFRAQPLEDSNLVARSIGQSQTHLVASPDFLEKHGRPKKPADLAALPSLGKSRYDGAYTWQLHDAKNNTQVIHHQPLLDSDDWMMIKQAAIAGLGLVAIPYDLCQQELATGELEVVLPTWQLPGNYLYIVYTSRRGLIPAVRAFIDYAAKRLEAQCTQSELS